MLRVARVLILALATVLIFQQAGGYIVNLVRQKQADARLQRAQMHLRDAATEGAAWIKDQSQIDLLPLIFPIDSGK